MKQKLNKVKYLALSLWFVASFAGAATLSTSPSSGTYASGGTFTVDVVLNTTGAQIDGVDVRYLRFNPNMLQVVDANSSASGIQIAPGSLMPSTLTNIADNSTGLITFSQLVAGGQHYSGSGTLFTVTFRALSGGTASLTFDAAGGNTTDSNVASAGSDVLTSALGASFSISGAVTAPAPSPTPTPGASPTPTPTPTPTPGYTPTPTPTPGYTPTPTPGGVVVINLPRTISVGSTGSDVVQLQNFLIASGYLAAGSNSGYFGQLTRAAVQQYQCSKGLACSGSEATTGYGLVGIKTRAMISGGGGVAVTPTPTPTTPTPSTGVKLTGLARSVYFGARGTDITALQNFLIARAYLAAGSNTGYFGALTRAAVRKYQCEKMSICSGDEGSNGYGLVGARTRASMSQ